MKKSELIKIIKEELKKIISEQSLETALDQDGRRINNQGQGPTVNAAAGAEVARGNAVLVSKFRQKLDAFRNLIKSRGADQALVDDLKNMSQQLSSYETSDASDSLKVPSAESEYARRQTNLQRARDARDKRERTKGYPLPGS